MRLDKSIFHAWFYAKPGEIAKGKSNVSFNDNAFFSYNTVIAQKETAKDGRNVLFISYYSMTPTTGGHLSALRGAMPSEWIRLQFPFNYGNRYTLSLESIRKAYEAELEGITEDMLNREENRHMYKAFASAYRQCCELFKWLKKDTRKTLKMLDKKDKVVEAVEAKREAARQGRIDNAGENARKRAERLKRKLSRVFTEFRERDIEHASICETARNLYGHGEERYSGDDFRDALRAWMTTQGGRWGSEGNQYCSPKDPTPFEAFVTDWMSRRKTKHYHPGLIALVWVEDNSVKTSMGVSVSVNHVREAFRVFDSLEDKSQFAGYTIHHYRVNSVTEKTMTIGCHHIPIENINELRKLINQGDEK